MITSRETVHDCMKRVRVRYHVAPTISEQSLETYRRDPTYTVQCYDARALLPQARVIFHVTGCGGDLEIAGAFGLDYVTVTYARNPHLEQTMAAQENLIGTLS